MIRIFFCVLLVWSLALSQILLLSSPDNEGGFGIKDIKRGLCIAGRRETEEDLYDALLGYVSEGSVLFYLWGTESDEMVYSAEAFSDGCLFPVVTTFRGNMDVAFVSLKDEVRTIKVLGSDLDEMVWFIKRTGEGYLAVGGVRERDWDIWVLFLDRKLNPVKSLRLGTPAEEYAYGAVFSEERIYAVGRTNFRGNWDGFVVVLNADGKLLKAEFVGTQGKDYFRYAGLIRGEVLAVGRSETDGDSDIFMFSPIYGRYWFYDVGTFDYGRAVLEKPFGYLVLGETEVEGNREGLLVVLDRNKEPLRAYLLGGDGPESVRHGDGDAIIGYTYSFSLSGDLFFGRPERSCVSVLRPYPVLRSERSVMRGGLPLKVTDHPLREVSLKPSFKRVFYTPLDLCQE